MHISTKATTIYNPCHIYSTTEAGAQDASHTDMRRNSGLIHDDKAQPKRTVPNGRMDRYQQIGSVSLQSELAQKNICRCLVHQESAIADTAATNCEQHWHIVYRRLVSAKIKVRNVLCCRQPLASLTFCRG